MSRGKIISNPDLTIAQCKAGVVGSFPSLNARPLSQLDEWLARITEELAAWDREHPDQPSAPFAVNQIVHKTNGRLEHDLRLCVQYKVPVVITPLGAVEEVNQAVHSYGGIVLHDIIHDRHARKAIEKGADGLIAVAAGAGGHAGTLSPFALVQEIRQWFDGPLLLSGAIAHGGAVLAAEAMGADEFKGEDAGFAINGGRGWKDVTFRNHQIDLNGPTAQAMGDYVFTDATSGDKVRVEYTFGCARQPLERATSAAWPTTHALVPHG